MRAVCTAQLDKRDEMLQHGICTPATSLYGCQRRVVSQARRRRTALLLGLCTVLTAGCGTTRWTNSPRTATEMLLISNAIDRSVDQMDFHALAGETVYFDPEYLSGTLDYGYIVSSIRQKLLASDCILKENREEARIVIEARSGGVGTDQHDLTFGVPSVNIPPVLGAVSGVPASIPEVPLIKKSTQKGLAKLAVFAYERETGRAIWQSGAASVNSSAQNTWILGAGPFQRGTIYDGTKFAGGRLTVPKKANRNREDQSKRLSVTDQAVFLGPSPTRGSVQLADHEEPVNDAGETEETTGNGAASDGK